MGWSCSYKRPRQPIAKFFEEHGVLSWSSNSPRTYQVLDTAFVRLSEFYAALKITESSTGESRVVALVILVKMFKEDKHAQNICYKFMDESCFPNPTNCPSRILNLLTATDNENSLAWRKACLDKIEVKKRIPKLKKGVILDFDPPAPFMSGPVSRLVVDGTRGQQINCSDTNGCYGYRLKRPWLNKQVEAGHVRFS